MGEFRNSLGLKAPVSVSLSYSEKSGSHRLDLDSLDQRLEGWEGLFKVHSSIAMCHHLPLTTLCPEKPVSGLRHTALSLGSFLNQPLFAVRSLSPLFNF